MKSFDELVAMSPEELEQYRQVETAKLYARATPAQKQALDAAQEQVNQILSTTHDPLTRAGLLVAAAAGNMNRVRKNLADISSRFTAVQINSVN